MDTGNTCREIKRKCYRTGQILERFMYDQVYSLVSYPPEFNTENGKMDSYATLYWKSWEYEENVESSRDLAIYIIKEYCEQRMWMEEKYSRTVS